MPRLPDLFPEAGPARRGMRGWRIPLGRGRVCARASALQKRRCPAQFSCLAPLSSLSAEECGCNPVFAGVGAFPAMRGMFKRPSAALSAGGEPSEGAVFLRSCPGVPTSAQGHVFLPRRGARATGKLHARRSCDGFTQGAACPFFPAEDFRAGGPRTRRGRAGRQRSSEQVVRGRFVTDGQPRLRRGTGRSALNLPGGCSALP